MRKLLVVLFIIFVSAPAMLRGMVEAVASPHPIIRDTTDQPRVLAMPAARGQRRGVRGDRRRHRGIGHAYGRAGRSAGRGSKRLASNTVHGRPVRGGKEFGKGMGGFGKHTGIGTARVGKKVGGGIKRAVTP